MEADLYEIYGSMVTACKREKRQDLVEKYSQLYEKHKSCHAKLLKQDTARITQKKEHTYRHPAKSNPTIGTPT